MNAVDLFAGPGGWEAETTDLVRPIGIEHDASACLTRAAAGHLTIRADVRTLDTARFRPLEGLIASPPCPTFSAAGGRAGIAELRYLIAHAHACVTGWMPYEPPRVLGYIEQDGGDHRGEPILPDPRSALVLEPLRFALECVPTWIALEQVPDVLPVWEAMQYVLRANGWSVWCGILNSADFGVPQTRRRAILMAHRKREVQPPAPTHCEGGASTMFGELLPWVSMAEALGWGDGFSFGDRDRKNGTIRLADQPAPTIPAAADNGGFRFLAVDRRTNSRGPGGTTVETVPVPVTRPAPTVTALSGCQWIISQPATTIAADPRITARCHHDEGSQGRDAKTTEQVRAGDYEGTEPIKLTVTEALRLQSFPGDYPVQGTKTKRFEQIGNAIPPILARAILSELAPRYLTREKQG